MYQIIYTKSGHKRGAKSINEVERILTRIMYNRREAKAYEVQTGEPVGKCACVNAEKDFWRVTVNEEVICESETLRTSWIDSLKELHKYKDAATGETLSRAVTISLPSHKVRATLNRKHPGVYLVETSNDKTCSVWLR